MDAKSILHLVVTFLGALFKSHRQLTLENLALRQQVSMLRQSVKRPRATVMDGRILILSLLHFEDSDPRFDDRDEPTEDTVTRIKNGWHG
jgi:hypothetical protein